MNARALLLPFAGLLAAVELALLIAAMDDTISAAQPSRCVWPCPLFPGSEPQSQDFSSTWLPQAAAPHLPIERFAGEGWGRFDPVAAHAPNDPRLDLAEMAQWRRWRDRDSHASGKPR